MPEEKQPPQEWPDDEMDRRNKKIAEIIARKDEFDPITSAEIAKELEIPEEDADLILQGFVLEKEIIKGEDEGFYYKVAEEQEAEAEEINVEQIESEKRQKEIKKEEEQEALEEPVDMKAVKQLAEMLSDNPDKAQKEKAVASMQKGKAFQNALRKELGLTMEELKKKTPVPQKKKATAEEKPSEAAKEKKSAVKKEQEASKEEVNQKAVQQLAQIFSSNPDKEQVAKAIDSMKKSEAFKRALRKELGLDRGGLGPTPITKKEEKRHGEQKPELEDEPEEGAEGLEGEVEKKVEAISETELKPLEKPPKKEKKEEENIEEEPEEGAEGLETVVETTTTTTTEAQTPTAVAKPPLAVPESAPKAREVSQLEKDLEYYGIKQGARFISDKKGFIYEIISPIDLEDKNDLRDVKFRVEVRNPAGAVFEKETDAQKLIKQIESGNFGETGKQSVADRTLKKEKKLYKRGKDGFELVEFLEEEKKQIEEEENKNLRWYKRYGKQAFNVLKNVVKSPVFVKDFIAEDLPMGLGLIKEGVKERTESHLAVKKEKQEILDSMDIEKTVKDEERVLKEEYDRKREKYPRGMAGVSFEEYKVNLSLDKRLRSKEWQIETVSDNVLKKIKESKYLTEAQKKSLFVKLMDILESWHKDSNITRKEFMKQVKKVLNDYVKVNIEEVRKFKKIVEKFGEK